MTTFKIAIIGAGSVGFTKKLCSDILKVPEFADVEIALTDISQHNLDMIAQIIRRVVEVNGLQDQGHRHDRSPRRADRRALCDELWCASVGWRPLPTTSASRSNTASINASATRSARAASSMASAASRRLLDFCKDIREVAEPNALLLNYANPMAMMTWAALEHGGVRTVGLCHGVQNGHRQIARALGLPKDEIDIICSGINHQTWYLDIRHKDRKISRDELIAAFEAHPVYSQQEKVRIDVLKRFGFYSTESNGHLSEYLPWYRKRPEQIMDWISMDDWIHGETGGYLRYSTENRNWFEDGFPEIPGRGRQAAFATMSAPTNMPATSSRRWRLAASIAGISTSGTAEPSPTCRRTASSKAPVSSTASASTWSKASNCRWPVRPPARPRSMSSG